MHALGVLTASYNMLEFTLFCMLLAYVGLPSEAMQRLFAGLPGHARLSLLRNCLNDKRERRGCKGARGALCGLLCGLHAK